LQKDPGATVYTINPREGLALFKLPGTSWGSFEHYVAKTRDEVDNRNQGGVKEGNFGRSAKKKKKDGEEDFLSTSGKAEGRKQEWGEKERPQARGADLVLTGWRVRRVNTRASVGTGDAGLKREDIGT